jgi:hypothetical protein
MTKVLNLLRFFSGDVDEAQAENDNTVGFAVHVPFSRSQIPQTQWLPSLFTITITITITAIITTLSFRYREVAPPDMESLHYMSVLQVRESFSRNNVQLLIPAKVNHIIMFIHYIHSQCSQSCSRLASTSPPLPLSTFTLIPSATQLNQIVFSRV